MRLGDEDDLRKGPDPEDRDPMDSNDHDSDAEGHPIDLAALREDDALVEELAAGLVALGELPRESHGTDDELVAMLAAWVAEVRPDAESQAAAVTAVTAAAGSADENAGSSNTVSALRPPSGRGKHRAVVPYARRLAAAAALLMLGTSGVAIGASEASPGEALWPVSKVFYAERARSVEAAAEVNSGLEAARTALRQGRRSEAARAIATATVRLDEVRPAEGRAKLAQEQENLLAALSGAPSASPATRTPLAPSADRTDGPSPGTATPTP
ncbi:hypothetical protein HF577_27325, partial [Pseudonocardia xinjiangensis]